MINNKEYRIFSLGDQALTLDFGNYIDPEINKKIITLFNRWGNKPLTGMIEAIPAYSSITIYYDLLAVRKIVPKGLTAFDWMKRQLEKELDVDHESLTDPSELIRIPVCYDGCSDRCEPKDI